MQPINQLFLILIGNHAENVQDTTRQKLLAVVWTVLLLLLYLKVCRFTVCIYHDALEWILNRANSTGKLARWQLRLSEFE